MAALLLHGTADPVVASSVAEMTAQRIPNAELVLIEDGLHLMIGTDTAILHVHLQRFLSQASQVYMRIATHIMMLITIRIQNESTCCL